MQLGMARLLPQETFSSARSAVIQIYKSNLISYPARIVGAGGRCGMGSIISKKLSNSTLHPIIFRILG